MAEIVHQTVIPMTAQRWQTYLPNVVWVAPAFPAANQFIETTAFNLPATIKGVEEKARNWIDKCLMNGNPPIQIPFNALEFFIAVSVAIKFYDTVGYRIIVKNIQQGIVLAIFETIENLNKRKKKSSSKKLTKLVGNNSLPFWLPKALTELDAIIGTRGIPLSYMTREDVVAPADNQLIQRTSI